MNLMASGLSMIRRALPLAAGVLITYTRSGESIELTAVEGKSAFDVADAQGGVVRYESRDFLVDATALVLGGIAATPQRGDKIELAVDGVPFTFEVSAPGGGEVYSREAHQTRIRIHTQAL